MGDLKFHNTLRFKGMAGLFALMVIIFFITYVSCRHSLRTLQQELISERLNSDILFLSLTLDPGDWRLDENGGLYKGNVYLGDGTQEAANISPFSQFESKTGTFCYVFRIDTKRALRHIEGGNNTIPYDEGHFLRVAGSTLDPNGNSIVGTYMSRDVSDILDREGYYEGEANVAGGMIYCVYKVIHDDWDRVIGATVVGRSTEALNQNINHQASLLVVGLAVVFLVSFGVQGHFINITTNRLKKACDYLSNISLESLPEEKLSFTAEDDFLFLSSGINRMVDNLRTTEKHRRDAETDTLTQIANRLGFSRIVESMARMESANTLAVSMLDIDYFKQLNDNYGHQEGDVCLQTVARIIRDACERYGGAFPARYGGDEFIIIYKDKTEEELLEINRFIRDGIHAAALRHEYSAVNNIVTLSMGTYLCLSPNPADLSFYIKHADHVLYKAKEQGRDNFQIETDA